MDLDQGPAAHRGLDLGPSLAVGFAVALTASVGLGAAMPSGAPGAYVTLGALLFVWCALSRPAAAAPLAVLWFLLSTGFVTDRHGVLGWHGTADLVLLGAYLLVAAAAAGRVLTTRHGGAGQPPGSSRT
jgi:hypothetical protein